MLTIFTTRCRLNLDLTLKVGERFRSVKFTFPVIYGNAGESTFSTHDDELADALKKHKDFNVVFFLKEEIGSVTSVATETAATKSIEDELCDPDNAIIVESVTTKGMAVAYIQGMYGESFIATTVEDMKREAAKKWNTLFPKWGK